MAVIVVAVVLVGVVLGLGSNVGGADIVVVTE